MKTASNCGISLPIVCGLHPFWEGQNGEIILRLWLEQDKHVNGIKMIEEIPVVMAMIAAPQSKEISSNLCFLWDN